MGFSERHGGHVHESLERPREMILVGVPAGEGDFAHGLVVLMQQLPGPGDTQRVDVFIKSYPNLLFECPLKTGRAHSACPGCFVQRDVFPQVFIDIFNCPPYRILSFTRPCSIIFKM